MKEVILEREGQGYNIMWKSREGYMFTDAIYIGEDTITKHVLSDQDGDICFSENLGLKSSKELYGIARKIALSLTVKDSKVFKDLTGVFN
jgi:hypothetical protein